MLIILVHLRARGRPFIGAPNVVGMKSPPRLSRGKQERYILSAQEIYLNVVIARTFAPPADHNMNFIRLPVVPRGYGTTYSSTELRAALVLLHEGLIDYIWRPVPTTQNARRMKQLAYDSEEIRFFDFLELRLRIVHLHHKSMKHG